MNSTWYWVAFVAYCVLMIGVGWYIRQKRKADEEHAVLGNLEFWMAKRQMPGWRLGVSLTSGWLMLGWVGFGMYQVYNYGATGLWILPIPWFILCWIIIFMVPYVRRIGSVSLPQALEMRYGPSARTVLAVLSFAVFLAWNQAELFMAGRLMSPFLGVDRWLCMTLFIIPPVIYTYLGGFRAMILTDLFQMALMSIFMIILAGTGLHYASAASHGDIVGALRNITPPGAAEGKMFDLGVMGWLFPIVLLIAYLPGWLIEQDLIIRIQAARSTHEARKGSWWGLALITTFVLVLPAIAAFCALVVFPPINGKLPEATVGTDGLGIIPSMVNLLPLGVSVFMFLGIVACQMSTVDTFANVSALALSYDVVEPYMAKRQASWQTRLGTARVISVLVLVLSLGCAFISESLNDVYSVSSGVLSACVAVPAFFMFWKRTTQAGVLAGALLGLVSVIGGFIYEAKTLQGLDAKAPNYYMDVLPGWLQGSYGYNYLAVGVLLSAATVWVVSLATRKSEETRLAAVRSSPVDNFDEFLKTAYPQTSQTVSDAAGN